MDTTQIVLISVIVVLTLFLVVIGFQVFFLIRDFRKTLARTNRLLDATDQLFTNTKKPIEASGPSFAAITTGVGLAHFLKKLEKKK